MRILLLILLTLVLQIPLLITELSLYTQKKGVRREVKARIHAGLRNDELIAVSLSEAQAGSTFQWLKKGEFIYNGTMYDVVRSVSCGNDTLLFCWADHEESRIKKMLDELHAHYWQHHPGRQQQQSKFWSFYQQLYVEDIWLPENTQLSDSGTCIRRIVLDNIIPKPASVPTAYTPPETPTCTRLS